MLPQTPPPLLIQRTRRGMIVSWSIVAAALITGLLVIAITDRYPRTDDAEVFANFIGIAPQVEGPLGHAAGAGQRVREAGRLAV